MISDVLAEAVSELDRYLVEPAFDRVYVGAQRDRIRWLRDGIELVRQELDDPPPPAKASA